MTIGYQLLFRHTGEAESLDIQGFQRICQEGSNKFHIVQVDFLGGGRGAKDRRARIPPPRIGATMEKMALKNTNPIFYIIKQ